MISWDVRAFYSEHWGDLEKVHQFVNISVYSYEKVILWCVMFSSRESHTKKFENNSHKMCVCAGRSGRCISMFSYSTFCDLLSEMYTSEHAIVLYICHKRINFICCFATYITETAVVYCNKNLLWRQPRCTHMHVQ